MNGASATSVQAFEVPSKNRQLVGFGDVDGEGTDDLV